MEDEQTIAHILSMKSLRVGGNPTYSVADGRGGYITGAICRGFLRCEVVARIAAFYRGNEMVFAVPWADDQEKRRILCAGGAEFGCSRCEVGKSGWVRRRGEALG